MRDVIEQYSQGNQDIMIRLKELQRRMDQTIGPPLKSNDKNRAKFTVNSRLSRLEDQMELIHTKLDRCVQLLIVNCNVDEANSQLALDAKETDKSNKETS